MKQLIKEALDHTANEKNLEKEAQVGQAILRAIMIRSYEVQVSYYDEKEPKMYIQTEEMTLKPVKVYLGVTVYNPKHRVIEVHFIFDAPVPKGYTYRCVTNPLVGDYENPVTDKMNDMFKNYLNKCQVPVWEQSICTYYHGTMDKKQYVPYHRLKICGMDSSGEVFGDVSDVLSNIR